MICVARAPHRAARRGRRRRGGRRAVHARACAAARRTRSSMTSCSNALQRARDRRSAMTSRTARAAPARREALRAHGRSRRHRGRDRPAGGVDGEVASSTRVRGLLARGDSRPPSACSAGAGTSTASSCTAPSAAARSASRPRTSSPTSICRSRRGIYAVTLAVDGARRCPPSRASAQTRRSSTRGASSLEVHVLDLDGDLYDQTPDHVRRAAARRGEVRLRRGPDRADPADIDAARAALEPARGTPGVPPGRGA